MKRGEKVPEETGNQKKRYTPMDEPVMEKSSSAPNIQVEKGLLDTPIEEVNFIRPGAHYETNPLKEPGTSSPGNNSEAKPGTDKNQSSQQRHPDSFFADPNLRDLPPNEKTKAAEQAVNMVLNGYGKLLKFANKRLMIKDKKILSLISEGKLDLRSLVPYDTNEWMSIGDLIKEYNEEAKTLLFVDPEWRAEITPPMVRVFEKMGLGMSDEAVILTMLATNVTFQVQMGMEFVSRTNAVLQFAVEQTDRMKGVVVPMSRHSDPAPAPAPAPAPQSPSQPAPVVHMEEQSGDEHQETVSMPIQDAVRGTTPGNTGAMGGSVRKQRVPKWGSNAEKVDKKKKHKKRRA